MMLSGDSVNNSKVLLDYINGNNVFFVVRAEMLQARQFEVTSNLLVGAVS
jgi:hypothetical protein